MATGNHHFDKFVAAGNPVGEVIAVDKFLVRMTGLQPVSVHALIMQRWIERVPAKLIPQDRAVYCGACATGVLCSPRVAWARWQSGHAAACKAAYVGSIPSLASTSRPDRLHPFTCLDRLHRVQRRGCVDRYLAARLEPQAAVNA